MEHNSFFYYLLEDLFDILGAILSLPFHILWTVLEKMGESIIHAFLGRNPRAPVLYDMFWSSYKRAEKRGWRIL